MAVTVTLTDAQAKYLLESVHLMQMHYYDQCRVTQSPDQAKSINETILKLEEIWDALASVAHR